MEGKKRLLKIEHVAEAITWIIILATVVFIRITPSSNIDDDTLLAFAGLVLAFALFYYYVLYKILPFTKRQWVKSVGDVILIGILIHLARDFSVNLITLFFMPIAAGMFILGSMNSLLIAILAVIIVAMEFTLNQGNLSTTSLNAYSPLWSLVSLLIAVIYTRILAYQVHYEKNLRQETQHQLKLTEKKMHDFEELEKEFVSLTAHQLFTPLSVIRGFLSMMLQGDTGQLSPKQKQYVDESYHYTKRMVHLVKELLNISRIESGHYILQPKPLDITDLIEDTIKELDPAAKARNITLKFDTPSHDLPSAIADKEKTPEIFLNIIHNAVKYSPEGSEVNIILQAIHRDNKPYLKIDIQDHGLGIPQDEQQYIFRRFFRATNILSHDNQGTGLGLFIAKQLVEQQNGHIEFTSKEGDGTTFTITLPASQT